MAVALNKTHPNADTVFTKARDEFLSSLSPTEQSIFQNCSTAEKLIQSVAKFARFQQDHSTWADSLKKITALNGRLKLYFATVEKLTCIQSNPDISTSVWGAIHLVLLLANNFGSFFDKLLDILDKLGQKLPMYKNVLEHLPKNISQSFQDSLKNLYRDLFVFFTAIAKVFRRANGEPRRAVFVVPRMAFRPFELEYKTLLDKIKLHCEILSDLQRSFQTQMVFETRAKQIEWEQRREKEQKDLTDRYDQLCMQLTENEMRDAVLKSKDATRIWLNPPNDQHLYEALERANIARLNGTAQWIFGNSKYQTWTSTRNKASTNGYTNMLWIRGNPGTGKTVLASSVLKNLQNDPDNVDDPPILLSYFFLYKYSVTRSPRTAWSLMLSYILEKYHNIPDVLNSFSFTRKSSTETYAQNSDLVELLNLVAYRLPRLVLLLDGVDESDRPNDVCSSIASILQGNEAKALLFSRPNILLQSPSNISPCYIDIIRNDVENDIGLLIRAQLAQYDFNGSDLMRTLPDAVARLVESANGMILWAQLMMVYLRLLNDTDERVKAIIDTPQHDDLVNMYVRILRIISKRHELERNMARRVFLYLTFTDRHLNATELWEVVVKWKTPSLSPGLLKETSPTSLDLEKFHADILVRCGSLVEKGDHGYGFIHQSALEFFRTGLNLDKSDCKDPDIAQFFFRQAEGHNKIVMDSITYLITRFPSSPLSGDMRRMIDRHEVAARLPFAAYASLVWPTHLQYGLKAATKVLQSDRMLLRQSFFALAQMIQDFFSNRLAIMTWIELQYTMSDNIWHLEALVDWCATFDSIIRKSDLDLQELRVAMSSFYGDLKSLHSKWGPTLTRSPHFIWGDITAFFDSKFLQKTSAVTVHSLGPLSLDDPIMATEPLATISRESDDGRFNVALSIWPTKTFEQAWKNEKPLDKECNGWIVSFHKYDKRPNPPQLRAEIKIALESHDLEQHLKSSLIRRRVRVGRFSSSPQWSLALPMAIGSRLDLFVVLGNIYALDAQGQGTTTESYSLRSHRIPTVSIPNNKSPRKPSSKAEPAMMASTYSYQINDSGQYILRQNLRSMTLVSTTSDPIITSMSLFGSKNNGDCWKFLAHYEPTEPGAQLAQCSFHPFLPLIMFHIKELGRPNIIRLWSFGSTFAGRNSPQFLTNSLQPSQGIFSTPCPPVTGIQALYFSACGRNAIYKCSRLQLLHVQSLEMDAAYQEAQRVIPSQQSPVPTFERTIQRIETGQAGTLMLPDQRLETGQSVLTGTTAYDLGLSAGTSQRALEVTTWGDERASSQHILSFPDSWDISGNSINVSIDESSTLPDHLDITVNQRPKYWYSHNEGRERFSPFLARKHVDAMLPPEHCHIANPKKRPADMIDDAVSSSKSQDVSRVSRQRLLE